VPARVIPLQNGAAMVELLSPEESVAPGQACVFYQRVGTRVLGGGWIARAAARQVAAE
jgi:tRNA-uridine 2-sulfurtransferase